MIPTPLPGRLLRRILPLSVRDVVLGDLDEEHQERMAMSGRRAADWWYWRQAVTSVPGAWRLAVRERRRRIHLARPREASMAQVWLDVRYALRTWRRQPGFAVTAIATQALGIAVTTAVATLAYGILLRPLPYRDPDALLRITEGDRSGMFSYADFIELRRSTRSLSHVAGFSGGSRTLQTAPAEVDRVPIVEVTDGFFETLGVPAVRGRTFTPTDTAAQAAPVVILGHRTWTRRFGADPAAVGRTVILNGRPHTVIGILPETFHFPMRGLAELWLPLRPSPAQEQRGYWHWMDVVGRRNPGVTDAQVAADLALVAQGRAAADPRWHADARLKAGLLSEEIVRPVRPALLILSGAVLLLLLVACANVAGLLIARSGARAAEMSVRAAVGAGTGRLLRQLLTEILLLSSVAGALGLVVGHALVRAALAAVPRRHIASLPNLEVVTLTPEVVVFSLGLSLAVGVLFGSIPALRTSRGDLVSALRGTRGSSSARAAGARRVLVAAEIGLALVLATGTGLMGRSVARLMAVSPGFETGGLLTSRVALPDARYPDASSVLAMERRLRQRIAAIPGVEGVAHISQLPLTGRGDNGLLQTEPPRPDAPPVLIRTVSPEYFTVMGIPLLEGRALSDRDTADRPRVVLVNRALAAQVFDGSNAVGQRIWFEFFTGQPRWEIVGVVDDEQFESLDRAPAPVVYFPFAQAPASGFSLVVRSAQPLEVAPAARAAAAELDPGMPLFSIATMEQIVDLSDAVFFRRTMLALLVLFAACALLLSAVAVYSTLAQAVSSRTREIGIRVALGAGRADVMSLIVRQGMGPAAAGLVAGLAASLAATPVLRSLLYGVTPTDAGTLALAAGVLLAVAFAGCLVPAWRALRIDAAVTLKQE